jgi:hypothetical protein
MAPLTPRECHSPAAGPGRRDLACLRCPILLPFPIPIRFPTLWNPGHTTW